MNLVIPDVGLVAFVKRMVEPQMKYHLFANNFAPDKNTILTDFTEASVSGYAPQSLNGASFGTPVVAGHIATTFHTVIVFVAGTGLTEAVYGYYVTDDTDTDLLAFAIFDAGPLTLDDTGLPMLPILGDSSRYG